MIFFVNIIFIIKRSFDVVEIKEVNVILVLLIFDIDYYIEGNFKRESM